MNKYNKLPLKYIAITSAFGQSSTRYHYGVDLGWSSNYGGKNVNIYSMNDGVVIQKGYNSSAGNYIWIQTDIENIRWLHRYLHLNEPTKLNIGDKVTRDQVVGIMGTTGDSTGNHLHFELWKCPKGYKYNWNDRTKYVVNPMNHAYLFEEQVVNAKTLSKVTKIIGTSLITEKNKEKDQVEVVNSLLRCRKSYGLKALVLGYIDYGIYDILDIKESDNYIWYKLKDDMWIAKTDDVVFYSKEVIKKEISDEETEIKSNTEDNLTKFIATKDGKYYIYLTKDEYLYLKK